MPNLEPIARRRLTLGLVSLLIAGCTGTRGSASRPSDSSTDSRSTRTSGSARKLRILCLHGYHGSAEILRSQMAAFAGALQSIADFVFVDAPSLAARDFGWWHAVDAEQGPADDDPGVSGPRRHYKGWARTRDAIAAFFEQYGPFDGILGFSQGAALAGLLVGLRAPDGRPTSALPLRFAFAIVVSGFSSNDPELARLYARQECYDVPSLHIVGRADVIVPIDLSRKLASRFKSPVIVEHDGGHEVPSAPSVVERARTFLEERVSERDGSSERAPIDVSLWAGRSSPSMRVVFPKRRHGGAALVVFRGGAYATNQGSGAGAAEWAAENGMVGIEVAYRCQGTGDAYPKNYADAARALRIVRARASEWGIDEARIGVLGFSAGGHLASLVSTQPAAYFDPADDLATRVSARPDFVILAYPLISFIDGYAPGAFVGSTENFFGTRNVDELTRRQFSNELHVTREHPPAFVWTTDDDTLVPASHSKQFALACERAGVPVTFELFAHGPHGMGLALGDRSDVSTWTRRALDWLRARHILEAANE